MTRQDEFLSYHHKTKILTDERNQRQGYFDAGWEAALRTASADFVGFRKIPRLARAATITEKIDGTNASIVIDEWGGFRTGAKNGWITPGKTSDNFGFSAWAHDNKEELLRLGPGRHFGEWWGKGIQRGYGLADRRFSLFNTEKWADASARPKCCEIVPVLWTGIFSTINVYETVTLLRERGSFAAPGFMKPEGVIVYHSAGDLYFKMTVEKDNEWKGKSQ